MVPKLLALLITAFALAGCGIKPDPPPEIAPSDYGGMGVEMARCMKYASESTCLQQTWGGDDFGD